ncbi:hypothetical protein ABK040_003709 [Willaertia magna]
MFSHRNNYFLTESERIFGPVSLDLISCFETNDNEGMDHLINNLNISNLNDELFKSANLITTEYFENEFVKEESIQKFNYLIRCLLSSNKTRKICLDFIFDLLTCNYIEPSGKLIMSLLSEIHSTLYYYRNYALINDSLNNKQNNNNRMEDVILFDKEDDEEYPTLINNNTANSSHSTLQKLNNNLNNNSLNDNNIFSIKNDLKTFAKEKINLISNNKLKSVVNNNQLQQQENGVIAFLELMPIIISTCQFLSDRLIDDSNESDDIIHFILEQRNWQPKYLTSYLNIFLDVKISEQSTIHLILVKKIKYSLSQIKSNALEEELDVSGLVQLLLKLAEQYNSQSYNNLEYIQVIKYVFNKCATKRDNTRLNLYFIIQSALQYSLPLLNIVLKSFENFYVAKPESVNKCEFNEHFCDLMILLLAYKNELVKEKVLFTLNQFIQSLLKHITPHEKRIPIMITEDNSSSFFSPNSIHGKASSSSSSSNHEVIELTETYYVETLISFACTVELISEELLSVLGEWCRMNNRLLNTIGKNSMIQLFTKCENSQQTILQKVITGIAEDQSQSYQKEIYLTILENLLTTERVINFSERVIDTFIDYIFTLDQYQFTISSRVLNAVLIISDISIKFKEEILNKLYKLCKDDIKINENRKLAIYGLCILLSYKSYKDDQVDILYALQYAFKFNDLEMKKHLYKSLRESLLNIYNQSLNNIILNEKATEILFNSFKDKILKYFTKNNKLQLFDLEIEKCFDDVSPNNNEIIIELKEPLDELIYCCTSLNKVMKCELKEEYQPFISFFDKLFESLYSNFTNISNLLNYLNIFDKNNKNEKSFLSVNLTSLQRLDLILPLIQILIEEFYQKEKLINDDCIKLLELYSLLLKVRKTITKKNNQLGYNHLTFECCINLCIELCNRILKKDKNLSLLISLNYLIDELTNICEKSNYEKLNDNFLKIITKKDISEIDINIFQNNEKRKYSFIILQSINILFPLFILFFKKKLNFKKSKLVNDFEKYFKKLFTKEKSLTEKLRFKILNFIEIYFTNVKLSEEKENVEKLLNYLFHFKHVKKIILQKSLQNNDKLISDKNNQEEEENNEEEEFNVEPFDFIVLTFYFCKLLYLEQDKQVRVYITYLKLIKTFASIHPFIISIGIPTTIRDQSQPSENQEIIQNNNEIMNEETDSSSDDSDSFNNNENNLIKPLKMDPRLRECCLMIERIICFKNNLKVLQNTSVIKLIIMFLLNFSSVSQALNYCKEIIEASLQLYENNNENKMIGMIKTREGIGKSLAIIFSYLEFIINKLNDPFKRKIRSGNTFHKISSFTILNEPLANHWIISKTILENISNCLQLAFQLVYGEFSDYGTIDIIISKLDKILIGLCNYITQSCLMFTKQIKKQMIKEIFKKMINTCQNFKIIYQLIQEIYKMNDLSNRLDLSKSQTNLLYAIEKMTYEVRQLNQLTKRKKKRIEPLEELSTIEFNVTNEDNHNKEKRKTSLSNSAGNKSKRKKNNNPLRSKNRYIDFALCGEGDVYSDTYADLEGWIDDEEWSPSKERNFPLL